MPALGDRGKPSLFTLTLETQPAVAEFARDGHAALEWRSPPLRRFAAVKVSGVRIAGR